MGALYHIRVSKDGDTYVLKKRFSEFSTLHDQLKSRFGPTLNVELPAKTAVRQFAADKLEDRKHALNAYLKEICRNPALAGNADVVRFLENSSSMSGGGAGGGS